MNGFETLDSSDAFFQGYLTHEIKTRIREGRAREVDVSSLLASAVLGGGARTIIDVLLSACGVSHSSWAEGMTTEDGWEYLLAQTWEMYTGAMDKPQIYPNAGPDFVVLRKRPNTDVRETIVAIELKGTAAINSGPDKCPSGMHPVWGSQVYCYPMGCWLKPASRALNAARYVWLAPLAACQAFTNTSWGSPPLGVVASAPVEYRLLELSARERLWSTVALEDLCDHLEFRNPGGVTAEAIRAWLAQRGG